MMDQYQESGKEPYPIQVFKINFHFCSFLPSFRLRKQLLFCAGKSNAKSLYLCASTKQISMGDPRQVNLNTKAQPSNTYDAIVVGSGISGGWAAKELCEKGLKTLVLERGRNVE